MRILMFGWEFPPHISGGLGTACYGLTKALRESGTDVEFVVPRAFGDEDIPVTGVSDAISTHLAKAGTDSLVSVAATHVMETEEHVFSLPVRLDPYYVSAAGSRRSLITRWNYSFVEVDMPQEHGETIEGEDKDEKPFSGGYGTNLITEVTDFARLGGELSCHLDFDVVHAHDWMTYMAGIEVKRRSGKPLLVHIHATEFDRGGDSGGDEAIRSIERAGFDEADRIVAVSNRTKMTVSQRYGIDEKKIDVVHNGILPLDVNILTKKKRRKTARHLVTFLGRVTWQKGPMYFVEAAAMILQRFPETHFLIAGAGDLLPSVIERVAHLRLSNRFHFTGFVSGEWLNAAWELTDVYVMPSASEPFGITPLEAAQRGKPVIISAQSGVSEVMPHAVIVDFWRSDLIADAVCSLIRHPSLRASLTRNGLKELEQLTWQSSAKKLNVIYEALQGRINETS